MARTAPLSLEAALAAEGCRVIAGVDEAGRGAWAGPVVAGAVCLPLDAPDLADRLNGLTDSKQLTPAARTRYAGRIHAVATAWGIGEASAAEIDEIGILRATCTAMRRAIEALRAVFPAAAPDYYLLDHIHWRGAALDRPSKTVVRGDSQSLSIAAASVLAKTHRDAVMTALGDEYPGYGFAAHKGYGTPEH
ncbi:MAG: ribonuclease HII, partial [Anaerolineae bacterium]|nr:ribonuclease HII [Anaerolineae bacterium]